MDAVPVAEFWKYEGTANDFVVVESEHATADLDPATVAKLCDRHRGIGADGVLLVTPSADGADARMVVRNADGSRPEMCGNGLRCVALHVAARRARPSGATVVTVQTDAGDRVCRVELVGSSHDDDPGGEGDVGGWVTVDMGRISVGRTVEVPFRARVVPLVGVDAGNPHAVAFEGLGDDELDALGAELQRSTWWPQGVNLERVVIQPKPPGAARAAGVRVYERGVGRTLACGTGACAVAAAIVARGAARVGEKIVVVLPGGPLEIVIDGEGRASMRGSARRVFAGTVALPGGALRWS